MPAAASVGIPQPSDKGHEGKQSPSRAFYKPITTGADENCTSGSQRPDIQQPQRHVFRPPGMPKRQWCNGDTEQVDTAEPPCAQASNDYVGCQQLGQLQGAMQPVLDGPPDAYPRDHIGPVSRPASTVEDSEAMGNEVSCGTINSSDVHGKLSIVSAASPGRRVFAARVTLTRPTTPASPASLHAE